MGLNARMGSPEASTQAAGPEGQARVSPNLRCPGKDNVRPSIWTKSRRPSATPVPGGHARAPGSAGQRALAPDRVNNPEPGTTHY